MGERYNKYYFNIVPLQAMWAEVIKKENAMIGVPHKFFLNPNKLVFIARKPTEVDPRTYEADSFSTGNRVRAYNYSTYCSTRSSSRFLKIGRRNSLIIKLL